VYHQLRKKKLLSKLDGNLTTVNNIEGDTFSAEDAAKIHRCLKELQPEYKEVLMLRFLEQMSYKQISKVINCNLGTVKSRIHYAKLVLRKEMEK
jgi:RNA polymerase sigma-70 factor (ECF subfamily)